MSLDCYPLESKKTISLGQQPLALDVAYNDNLFVFVMEECKTIVVFDLEQNFANQESNNNYVAKFSLGPDVVISQLVYCQHGDYLACVGHRNGKLSIYTVFNWRKSSSCPIIRELDLASVATGPDKFNFRDKLNYIDCCQRTGNLAVSCSELVLIFKYLLENQYSEFKDMDADSCHSQSETVKEFTGEEADEPPPDELSPCLSHIITIKVSISAQKVCLLENYLTVTSIDHVQVLKLELLTLQIQPDGQDGEPEASERLQQEHLRRQQHQRQKDNSDPKPGSEVTGSTTTEGTTLATTTTCSMISDSVSTTSNFSNFTQNNELTLNNNNNDNNTFNTSDISIITMNQLQQQRYYVDCGPNSELLAGQAADDCISWNLNTKKLVKLPTLMHNTSANLSSYHVCHPLELLGPASESIACRVSGSVYSPDLCQNQLEAVVMLCRQFDFDRDPIKSTHLKAIYLSSQEDLKRLSKSAPDAPPAAESNPEQQTAGTSGSQQQQQSQQDGEAAELLLKSADFELLASVTCFVSTLTTCFVYSLHNKRGVLRTQTITHPDLCLDLRPDLLNVYLLSPLGLQICTSGICDSTFRYDWSSSSDLNLSFIASNRISRVLTTSKYLVLVSSAGSETDGESGNGNATTIDCFEKPDLVSLHDRIVYTVDRCNSIGIRSNMLTYLHATAQLGLLDGTGSAGKSSLERCKSREILKGVTVMLAKQLLQKKQTNVITNNRIDKAIKHLLDISWCDLKELMERHWASLARRPEAMGSVESSELESDFGSSDELRRRRQHDQYKLSKAQDHHSSVVFNSTAGVSAKFHAGNIQDQEDDDCKEEAEEEDEPPLDTDYELIKIYLKYAKFSQTLLDYLVENSPNELFASKIIDYIFEHNPRLLIKCAQRYPLEGKANEGHVNRMLQSLVDKLRQLAELDSTGINRPTVLFTLAILYNALGEPNSCLRALDQIKPSNHLAITMCSNHEHGHSIAELVKERYSDVYRLFLAQLARKDKLAAEEYVARHGCAEPEAPGWAAHEPETRAAAAAPPERKFRRKSRLRLHPDGSLLDCSDVSSETGPEEEEEDEQEFFELKLKLLAEIPTSELVDLLVATGTSGGQENCQQECEPACRDYLEASIKLLESQFILARLRENSH